MSAASKACQQLVKLALGVGVVSKSMSADRKACQQMVKLALGVVVSEACQQIVKHVSRWYSWP